ncbi:hypothetical protein ACJZ2D_013038 [Fusarium nematophilum]
MSKSILTFLLAAAPALASCKSPRAATVSDSQCDCYVTNGTRPTYYSGHMFWDFRSLSQHAGVPPLIQTVQGNAEADFTSPFFNWESEFGQTWGLQRWNNGAEGFSNQNSYNNIYIEKNSDSSSDTYLTMRTARHNGFQSSAEFESIDKYQFASMRMLARSRGSAGACTAMFTYLGGETLADVQEADIEVLTSDPQGLIHYTNQPSYTEEGEEVVGASKAVTMPDGIKWTDWAAHRMDWTAEETIWSVNGKQTWANDFQVPRDPATLTFNAWSDGGDWTGKMPVGGVAYQQIQWIEILYGSADEGTCKRVCSVDETSEVGKPVRV